MRSDLYAICLFAISMQDMMKMDFNLYFPAIKKGDSSSKKSKYIQNFNYRNPSTKNTFYHNKFIPRKKYSNICQAGLKERKKNLENKTKLKYQEKKINSSLNRKVKSKRWAKRQHNWDYTL